MSDLGTAPVGLGEWPTMAARRNPGAVALRQLDGPTMTYGELEAAANACAAWLVAQGLQPGDRVAILATDSTEYVALLFGTFKAGLVVAPLNYRLTAEELADLVGAVDPRVLAVSPRYADLVPVLQGALPTTALVLELEGNTGTGTPVAQVIADHVDAAPVVVRRSDTEAAVWMLTSGTTGRPRVVVQPTRMLKANVVKGLLELQVTPADALYAGAPLFHVAGMGWVFYAISRGATMLLQPQFTTDGFWAMAADHGLTGALLVPSMVSALVEEVRGGTVVPSLPTLRFLAYGGSSMPTELRWAMHEVFACDLFNTFGAGTEAGGQTVLGPAEHRLAFTSRPELLESIGRAAYGVDVKVCGPDGEELPHGAVGEIWSRSDVMMTGYLDEPEETAAHLIDGWYRSSDLAYRSGDGYFFLMGRADDVIIRGGENIHPAEIENVVIQHPAVSMVAVVGLPDPRWGEVIAAAVVSRDRSLTAADVQAHCADRLSSTKRPVVVQVLEELPTNGTGKVLRREVREVLLRGLSASRR